MIMKKHDVCCITQNACFKDFSKEEIAEIYNNYKENQGNVNNDTDTTGVSINCS